MHVGASTQSEIAVTIDVAIEMSNALTDGSLDARSALVESGFSRAPSASTASIDRVSERMAELKPLLERLVEADTEAATRRVNEQLTELPVSPSIVRHDGSGFHIHWTPTNATFDDQVMTDILMALAQEICDNGTIRFGRCGAEDCERLFFDQTKNHSRRFCADPRCASRTHTADHRARRRSTIRGQTPNRD